MNCIESTEKKGLLATETTPLPTLDGYEILGRIGQGGMGEVFLARQIALKRDVAIKFLRPDALGRGNGLLERFHREATLMASVSDPHIVPIHNFGTESGRPFLVMDYLPGGDLRARLTPGEPMPLDRVARLLTPISGALVRLHDRGIIHRDLKPENILIRGECDPMLTDFGIAVLRESMGTLTGTQIGIGTPGYTAPEQQFGTGKVDERADQYAVAALAYELTTGYAPVGLFRPPSSRNQAIVPEIDAAILRGLADEPESRFPTLREFQQALVGAIEAAANRPVARTSTAGVGRRAIGFAAILLIGIGSIAIWKALPNQPAHLPLPENPSPPKVEPEAIDVKPSDTLVPILTRQLDLKLATLSDDLPITKDEWNVAVEDLFGHGPLAKAIERWIGDRAYFIWLDRRGSDQENWSQAVDEFRFGGGLDEVIRATIGVRAAEIHQGLGSPDGHDLEHWLRARSELIVEGAILPAEFRGECGLTLRLCPGRLTAKGLEPGHYLGEHEVTVAEFRRFAEASDYLSTAEVEGQARDFDIESRRYEPVPDAYWAEPGYRTPRLDDHPVVQVSYRDAVAYCAWLTESENLPYRLPDESEWLAAATEPGQIEASPLSREQLDRTAWYLGNSGGRPHSVGTKSVGPLGFVDLLGNVAEWCEYSGETADRDPNQRPIRGGSWLTEPSQVTPDRSVLVDSTMTFSAIGFRVALPTKIFNPEAAEIPSSVEPEASIR